MTRIGRPKKGAAESDLQMDMTFTKEGVEGEVLTNMDSGKRRVIYRDCSFNGVCRTGAYCTLINPIIKGVLRTGGDTVIIHPVFVTGGLIPGANNTIKN